jgi:hypothetical protein
VARELIAGTLAKSDWTHQAHLRAGLWHALHYPDDVALALLRERIRAYNEASGVANTSSSGYHETITRFYLRLIRHFLDSVDAGRPMDDLALDLIERCGHKDLPLRYYSPSRLFSAQARFAWVEPDLAPLPGGR